MAWNPSPPTHIHTHIHTHVHTHTHTHSHTRRTRKSCTCTGTHPDTAPIIPQLQLSLSLPLPLPPPLPSYPHSLQTLSLSLLKFHFYPRLHSPPTQTLFHRTACQIKAYAASLVAPRVTDQLAGEMAALQGGPLRIAQVGTCDTWAWVFRCFAESTSNL